ncbi:MAG: hypothetical protein ACT4OP_07350 [Actinomycetota bacterium]
MPVEVIGRSDGLPPTDLYVRRFWTAVLGPSVVADLLRITRAGQQGTEIRRPLGLQDLLRAGLAHVEGETIVVADRVPTVPVDQLRRLTPAMRLAHDQWLAGSTSPCCPPTGQGEGDQLTDQKT